MDLNQPGVYVITNTVSGSQYVGSAVNIKARWAAHKHALRKHGKAPPKLLQAWLRYGEDAFTFTVLELCAREATLTTEQKWIDVLRPKYNTRPEAASNIGVKWSAVVNASKGRPAAVYTVRGITGGIRALAKHFGVVTHETARVRVQRGMPVEAAVTTPAADRKAQGVQLAAKNKDRAFLPSARPRTYKGITAPLKDLVARFTALPERAVCRRLNLGWDIERAFTEPLRERTKCK